MGKDTQKLQDGDLSESLTTPNNFFGEEKPSPRSTNIRWFALFLLCFACFGNYYCGDLPQSLMNAMKHEMDLDNLKYGLIFSIYSFPNMILPFIGGLLVDYLGERIACVCFSAILIVGQSIATFGASQKNFTIILIGQFVFAMGGDCLLVGKSAMVSKWFRGKELSFALSAGLCVGRLGSSLDSFLSPRLYNHEKSLALPYFTSVCVLIFSFAVVCILFIVDKRTDEKEEQHTQKKKKPATKPSFKDLKSLPKIYFLLVLNCGFLYFGFYGFVNNGSDILINRFGFTQETAGTVMPIIFLTPVGLSPVVGFLVDKYGKRVLIIFLACCIYLVDNFVIAYFPDAPEKEPDYRVIGMLIALGIFYSAFAAVFWPCIALSVKPKMTGVAYGSAFVFQNTVLMIGPLLLGKIHDSTAGEKHGYFWTQITLAVSIAIAMGITAVIYFLDKKGDGKLDAPSTNASVKESLVDDSQEQ